MLEKKTSNNDAILVVNGKINNINLVTAAMDFSFMGGSMGMQVGEGIVLASQLAKDLKSPLLIIASSGGARMQEGILSLMQMPRTVAAIEIFKETKLPYIVLFTNPVTGGVSASFTMLGDILIAEPGALIGFAGPRVIKKKTVNENLPEGFQKSEYLLERGMMDLIVNRNEFKEKLHNILKHLIGKKDRLLQSYKYITHKNKKIEDILKSLFLLHPNNVDLSLKRIKKLLNRLNNPQKKIKNIIHIAGTNGKGSIATILYYLQKYQGKTVNIYRSPHLISFNERIHIKNKQVSNQYLLDVLEYVKEVNDKQPITFFEIITAATFYMFYQNLADLTILEVGLGGQFDATNIIENNMVSIISTIGIDHKEFLGSTIKAIANEKVGIIKKKVV